MEQIEQINEKIMRTHKSFQNYTFEHKQWERRARQKERDYARYVRKWLGVEKQK